MNPFQLYWSEQHQQGDVDNLQMGFDFEFIKGKNRLYGGLLIDEWAPYETFSGDENNDGIDDSRNWFASQIGFSRLFNLNAGYKDSFGKKWQRVWVKPKQTRSDHWFLFVIHQISKMVKF